MLPGTQRNLFAVLLLFLCLSPSQGVHARGFRVGLIPNGTENSCATCHLGAGGGGPRNLFGDDVNSLVSRGGREEFWTPDFAAMDSDLDGFTNGQELGDLDGDGVPERTLNLSLPGVAASVPETAPGDCNLDTVLSSDDLICVTSVEDRDFVLTALESVPGDLDGNGNVEFADFLTLSGNFGQSTSSYAAGDIDLSGTVDFADFLTLSGNFGFMAEANLTVVPEPATSWLTMASLFGLTTMRSSRRRAEHLATER